MCAVVWIAEADFPAIMQLNTDYDAGDIVYEIIPNRAEIEQTDQSEDDEQVNCENGKPVGEDLENSEISSIGRKHWLLEPLSTCIPSKVSQSKTRARS